MSASIDITTANKVKTEVNPATEPTPIKDHPETEPTLIEDHKETEPTLIEDHKETEPTLIEGQPETEPTQTEMGQSAPDVHLSAEDVEDIAGEQPALARAPVSKDSHYFRDDQVFLINKKGRFKFGLVVDTSDSMSDDDEEDSAEYLLQGQLRVGWYPEFKEGTYLEEQIGLLERTHMPGDVVKRSASGSSNNQRGYCRKVDMRVDLKVIGTEYVIRDVSATRLRLLNPWDNSVPVCLDSWVGTIKDVEEKAVLKLASGCRFEISSDDFHYFKNLKSRDVHGEYSHEIFYPGNTITGNLPISNNIKVLTPNCPLQKNRKGKYSFAKLTVEDVYTKSIHVVWHCKGLSEEQHGQTCELQAPKSFISGEDLKRVKQLDFGGGYVQLNDHAFLIYDEADELITMSEWEQEQTKKYALVFKEKNKRPTQPQAKALKKKSCKVANFPQKPGDRLVTQVMLGHSTICVVWQDGSIEENVPSTELYPLNHVDTNDFFPGDFVTVNKEKLDVSNSHDYGVVQTVDHEGSCACVKWFTSYSTSDEPQPSFNGETEVSVYDLKDHPDFQYHPGSQVIRVANFTGEDANSTAGQVVDTLTTGRVQVQWVEGHTSECWPQDIYEFGQDDHDSIDIDMDTDTETWETESESSEYEEFGSIATETQTLHDINHACDSMARLEKIFRISPSLQDFEVMKKLYNFFKNCRHFERLLNTNLFHERQFMELKAVLPKNEKNTDSDDELTYQVQILPVNCSRKPQNTNKDASSSTKHYAPMALFNIPSFALRSGRNERKTAENSLVRCKSLTRFPNMAGAGALERTADRTRSSSMPPVLSRETRNLHDAEKRELLSSAIFDSEYAFDHSNLMKWIGGKRDENAAKASSATKTSSNGNEEPLRHVAPELICERVCGFLRLQLPMFYEEVQTRFYFKRLIRIAKSDFPADATQEDADAADDVLGPKVIVRLTSIPPSKADAELLSSSSMQEVQDADPETFQMISNAPKNHKFFSNTVVPNNPKEYNKAVQREHRMLQRALPPGAWVKVFEDRMDLMSVMLLGPQDTPYEDGVFLFDLQLGKDYPNKPPSCHYISFCSERLNPNLYEDGKVCVSLLGTWSGKDTEVWGPHSTILQLIVSIQGLILVPEPYFNEAGYEKQKGTTEGMKNSQKYTEMAIVKLVQASTKLLGKPVEIFDKEIQMHFKRRGQAMYERIQGWVALSKGEAEAAVPRFPLIPASKGFCISLAAILGNMKSKLEEI